MKRILLAMIFIFAHTFVWAASDPFPPYVAAPSYTTYLSGGVPDDTFYCSPTGNNSEGDGTIGNPWFDLRGAQGHAGPGDLILFRGGTYTGITNGAHAHSSANVLTTDGTADDYIVIKNYPAETPLFDNKDYFSMSLRSYQVLDGINFEGGISSYDSHVVIQNCDFDEGCAAMRDGNPGMIVLPAEQVGSDYIIRNNTFHDPLGDHYDGNNRCYALCAFDSDGIQFIYNKLYNFNAPTSQRYAVYCKDSAWNLEIAYNRYYNSGHYFCGAPHNQ